MFADRNISLLVIDFQKMLLPHIEDWKQVAANSAFLIKTFDALGLPVAYSEQNPERLGQTVPEIGELLEGRPKIEKMSFSCVACEDFSLLGLNKQVVVTGVETHICVLQTVLELIGAGFETFVAEDACGSRHFRSHATSIDEMRSRGAWVLPSESIVYAILKQAGTDEFKRVLPFVKERTLGTQEVRS